MVTRKRGWLVCALASIGVACVLLGGSSALAYDPPSSPTPTNGSSGGSQSGSSGGSAQATVKTCHLYANPSGYGLSCVAPGSGAGSASIRKILGKEPLPDCFDTAISPATMAAQYPEYAPVTGSQHYVHTCITGLDPNSDPTNQPGEHFNNDVITIVDGAPACFNYDEAHHKATPFTPDQRGRCVMTLTPKQHQVVSGLQNDDGQIPDITIAQQPSTRVRTNEDEAYVDTENASNGSGTRTPDLTVGGVTLYAVMDRFKIYPYGPDGTSEVCDGTQQLGADDTRATKPDACWWTYPRSSADQPGMTYPFRAEADWTVHYQADGVDHRLVSFQKYDDFQLPVYDIQTLVVR